MVIAVPNTAIDKDTMMVSFGNAIAADTAVLGSSRFSLPTCGAKLTRNEKFVIVWIETAVYVEIPLEHIAWIHSGGKIEEDIRTDNNDNSQHFHSQVKCRKHCRQKHYLRYRHETDEGYLMWVSQ